MPVPDFNGVRATVMGLGLLGGSLGAAGFLARNGARVIATDLRSAEILAPSIKALEGLGIEFHLGGHMMEDFTSADLVVASPAVPGKSEFLSAARGTGVPVETEITLFMKACPSRNFIGITGSNGKTTTTAMTGDILARAGMRIFVGGNIGGSLLDRLGEISPGDAVVLELSSFQLEYLRETGLVVGVAALLNVTPNHLDRHGTMEEYEKAKAGIFSRHGASHAAVLNLDDPAVMRIAEPLKSRRIAFSLNPGARDGFILDGGMLVHRTAYGDVPYLKSSDLPLRGLFNRANALAASACAHAAGAGYGAIAEGLAAFKAVPHRLEFVAEKRGIKYYNDTIATTPESAIAALDSFDEPVVLIAGGSDKGVPLDGLAAEIARRKPAVVLIGQLARRLGLLISASPGGGEVTMHYASSLEDAVESATRICPQGGIVLLSPGAASFDMFRNFEHRGEEFRRIVKELD